EEAEEDIGHDQHSDRPVKPDRPGRVSLLLHAKGFDRHSLCSSGADRAFHVRGFASGPSKETAAESARGRSPLPRSGAEDSVRHTAEDSHERPGSSLITRQSPAPAHAGFGAGAVGGGRGWGGDALLHRL